MSLLVWFDSLQLRSLRVPPRDQWPKNARCRSLFGQDVLWHATKDGGRNIACHSLESYRSIGDPMVDSILQQLDTENRPLSPAQDLLQMAQTAYNNETEEQGGANSQLAKFYKHYSVEIPFWVDWEQLQRGQDVFLRYATAMGLSLYYRSLVPGFSIPKIAAVLCKTHYLTPPSTREQVQERLLDTGGFLVACMTSSLAPGREGWRAALHLRILHAKVRRRLLTKTNWDTQSLGIPINQEDMAATLLAFSFNSLLGTEFILGLPLPKQERLDYLALWRYIGWLLGVSTMDDETPGTSNDLPPLDPCGHGWIPSQPDPLAHSYAVFYSILFHILQPDSTSVQVSHHLLRIGRKSDGGDETSDNWFYFRALQCRRFVGKPLADALLLPLHPRWRTRLFLWTVSTVYLLLLRVFVVAALPYSPFRNWILNYQRDKLVNFYSRWKESHLQRMARIFLKRGTPEPTTNKQSNQSDSSKSAACPFGMVGPPQDDLSVGESQ